MDRLGKILAALIIAFIILFVAFQLVIPIWTFTPPPTQGYLGPPIVTDGFLYFSAQGEGGHPITLYCLKASTGHQVWSQNILSQYSSFTVADGCVYASEDISSTYLEGAIACLNDSTGAQLWNYTYGSYLGPPVVVGGTVYVGGVGNNPVSGFSGGFVFAFNASTGTKIWGYIGEAGTDFLGNLLEAGGNVYVHEYSGSNVYTLDAGTGEELWNITTSGQFSSYAADGQNLYISSNNGDLYSLNASNGNVIWQHLTGSSLGSVSVVNHYLYVGSQTGVYCFNAFNGAMIWNFKASAAMNPTYANGIVYVGWAGPEFFAPSNQHNFYALDATTGRTLWSLPLSYTGATCTVNQGTVYVTAGYVTTLSPDNIGSGTVFTLKPIITSWPLLPVSVQAFFESTILVMRIAVVIVVAIFLTVVFGPRKRLKRA